MTQDGEFLPCGTSKCSKNEDKKSSTLNAGAKHSAQETADRIKCHRDLLDQKFGSVQGGSKSCLNRPERTNSLQE